MIRKRLKYEKAVTAITDALVIFVAYILAVYIRYYVLRPSAPGLDLLSLPYLLMAASYSVIMACIMAFRRESGSSRFGGNSLTGFLSVNAFGCLGYLAFLYTIGEVNFSRWAMVLFWVISSILLIGKGDLLSIIFDKRKRVMTRKKRVLVVGEGSTMFDYLRGIAFDTATDFTVIGYVGNKSGYFFETKFESETVSYGLDIEEERNNSNKNNERGHLGGYDELEEILEKTDPEEVVFALEESEMDRFPELLEMVRSKDIKSSIVPGFNRYIPVNAAVHTLGDVKIIDMTGGRKKKDNSTLVEVLGLMLMIMALVLIMVLKKYNIGSASGLRMYESLRYILFGGMAFCLFLCLKDVLKPKKYRFVVQAIISVVICSLAAVLYEFIYGEAAEYIIEDIKMIVFFVAAGCAMKIIGRLIDRDSIGWYM